MSGCRPIMNPGIHAGTAMTPIGNPVVISASVPCFRTWSSCVCSVGTADQTISPFRRSSGRAPQYRWRDRKEVILSLLLTFAFLSVAGTSRATGTLDPPLHVTHFGTFDTDVDYVQYQGRFAGVTSRGTYCVPYEIVTPADPSLGIGRILLEPPHFNGPIPVGNAWLTNAFLFNRRFTYATVGYSTFGRRILDPDPGFLITLADVNINRLSRTITPVTDIEILVDFANALREDSLGLTREIASVYGVGLSVSGVSLHRILHEIREDGSRLGIRADGSPVFDLSILIGAGLDHAFFPLPVVHEPAPDVGRILIVNSEADVINWNGAALRHDDGRFPQYRLYEIAGGPHVPGTLGFGPRTGVDWLPTLRAIFVAGHRWVSEGALPPPSLFLTSAPPGKIDSVYRIETGIARDCDGNAKGGIRFPDLAIGRGQFRSNLGLAFPVNVFGKSRDLQYIAALDPVTCECLNTARFLSHADYVARFGQEVDRLVSERFLLQAEADRLLQAAVESAVGASLAGGNVVECPSAVNLCGALQPAVLFSLLLCIPFRRLAGSSQTSVRRPNGRSML